MSRRVASRRGNRRSDGRTTGEIKLKSERENGSERVKPLIRLFSLRAEFRFDGSTKNEQILSEKPEGRAEESRNRRETTGRATRQGYEDGEETRRTVRKERKKEREKELTSNLKLGSIVVGRVVSRDRDRRRERPLSARIRANDSSVSGRWSQTIYSSSDDRDTRDFA